MNFWGVGSQLKRGFVGGDRPYQVPLLPIEHAEVVVGGDEAWINRKCLFIEILSRIGQALLVEQIGQVVVGPELEDREDGLIESGLVMVSGSTDPRTASCDRSPCAKGAADATIMLCWLCTTPLGTPVVPLV